MNDKELVEKCLEDYPYTSAYLVDVLTKAIPIIQSHYAGKIEEAKVRGLEAGKVLGRKEVAEEIFKKIESMTEVAFGLPYIGSRKLEILKSDYLGKPSGKDMGELPQ